MLPVLSGIVTNPSGTVGHHCHVNMPRKIKNISNIYLIYYSVLFLSQESHNVMTDQKHSGEKLKAFFALGWSLSPNFAFPGNVFLLFHILILKSGCSLPLVEIPTLFPFADRFSLLGNRSPETQFTGPGKGSWHCSRTVWFWSLRELEKPPSFMSGLFLSAMLQLDASPLGHLFTRPTCL